MNLQAEVIIVGAGAIGLATAIELAGQGCRVTVLSRNFRQAALHAAAGMLAPGAEQIPPGPLQELCLRSRNCYPDWIAKLEALTGQATGYWSCGILSPVYHHLPHRGTQTPLTGQAEPEWLERPALERQQPGLSTDIVGGWWYPDDAQVDNRALGQTLWQAATEMGVTLLEGVAVQEIERSGNRVQRLQTSDGAWQAETYVLAAGAWSGDLLPVPITPRKGQMLSVRVPQKLGQPLQQVLFGEEVYIVPRQDGRIIVGATVETVGFTPGNTVAGIQQLLNAATRLYPCLQEFPLEELWWGFRPFAPDEQPILGASPWTNLFLATGHYRNGILLAPITAQLLTRLILKQDQDPLLQLFNSSV